MKASSRQGISAGLDAGLRRGIDYEKSRLRQAPPSGNQNCDPPAAGLDVMVPSSHRLGALLCGFAALSACRRARATSDAFDSPQPREDYRDVFEKPALQRVLAPRLSAPVKQGGGTPPTMFYEAARPNAEVED